MRLAALRNHKARLMIDGQKRTFDLLRATLNPENKNIWIHASSLGEFEQGRPLIERIKSENPDAHIVLSFFSPSGYEVRKNYDKVDVVCYLPFDVPSEVRKFIDLVNPSMAIFVKYEFWGNYLSELKRRAIPTYIISSIFREGQIFFRPWGGMFRDMLRCFTRIFVQNEESRQLLKTINIDNVEVAGDTRFDRVADVRGAAKEFPIIESFVANSSFTLVMGSSWQPDEDIVMPYFNEHPNMKLIVAPHEFDVARLSAIVGKTRRKAGLYSATSAENAAELDCLVIDCFGILSSLYRYGQMAYIGGGFGAGIHNINEAAVYGIARVRRPDGQDAQQSSRARKQWQHCRQLYLHPHRSHLAHLPRVVPQTSSIVCDHTHITSSQHPKSINQCLWGAVLLAPTGKSVKNGGFRCNKVG